MPERTLADGRIRRPLDSDALKSICDQLVEENIEAVAVCFLHAYTNPAHELAAMDIVREKLPDIALSASHQVAPGMREYPRSSTTVANAYVQPITERYLARVSDGLAQSGIDSPLNIMLSSGGTTTVDAARAFPIRLVESGPAGGALAGVYWGEQLDFDDVLAFDMGGTTAKAVLTRDGELSISNHSEVAHVHRFKRGSGLPLMAPMIEMIEIGAGGGSIAHLNALGLPAVGPQSAGSTPGPAAYGQGGEHPTVTDADLMLGYLNPDYFAGGSLPLDVNLARQSFNCLATALDLPLDHLAWGIHQLVNENMAAAARVHAAERGLEIRRYSMVATGGAGPVHACGVAQGLGIRRIIIPPLAGVGSAFGFLTAPISFDFTRSYVANLTELDLTELNSILRELEEEGRTIVEAAGVPMGDITVRLNIDMRYVGQGYEVRVPFSMRALDKNHIAEMRQAFEEEYRPLLWPVSGWRTDRGGQLARADCRPNTADRGAFARISSDGNRCANNLPIRTFCCQPERARNARLPAQSAERRLVCRGSADYRRGGVHHRRPAGLVGTDGCRWLPAIDAAARRQRISLLRSHKITSLLLAASTGVCQKRRPSDDRSDYPGSHLEPPDLRR